MSSILSVVQIIVSILLIITVLLQQTGAGVGGILGGSDDAVKTTRRGSEKTLLQITIVLGVIFAATAIVQLLIL